MGWTVPYNKPENKQDFLDRLMTWDREDSCGRVLKSAMRGSVYYAAVEFNVKETGEKKVSAMVIRTQSDKGSFAYKEMSEVCNPYYYDCPVGILKLLTPTENEHAIAWRSGCDQVRKEKTSKSFDPLGKSFSFNDAIKVGNTSVSVAKCLWKQKSSYVFESDSVGSNFLVSGKQLKAYIESGMVSEIIIKK